MIAATLDKLMAAVVRRCGDSLLGSPDQEAEQQEEELHFDPAAAEYVAWLSAHGLSLARPGDKKRLVKELLEEAERAEDRATKELEKAREAQAREGGAGRSRRFAKQLAEELEDLDAITRRILPIVRPVRVWGEERPESVKCRYYRTCRGRLTPREAWLHASSCASCREDAAKRRAGITEGGTVLDELAAL